MFNFLLAWYNLPFTAALVCSLGLSLLQFVGGFGDQDADVDVGADVDAELDIDSDADIDVGPDADVDGDVSSAGLASSSFFSGALGIGRVPLLLILMAFLGSFGAVGLVANTLLSSAAASYPAVAFLPVLLCVALVALLLTGRISHLFVRIAPTGSTAVGFEQLVGRVGMVVTPSVSTTYGRVQVKDRFGTLHTVYAVIDEGQSLPERSEVALLAYDAARRCFVVAPFDQRRRRQAPAHREPKI